MTAKQQLIDAIFVDDQEAQMEDAIDNLTRALSAHGFRLDVAGRFSQPGDAVTFLQSGSAAVDLVVTDVLWPKEQGESVRQRERGLEVVRYAALVRPEPLIVALSLGDDEHKRIAEDCVRAGAHVFRFHDYDLPGGGGSGWLELAAEIVGLLDAGRPYDRADRNNPAPSSSGLSGGALRGVTGRKVFIVHGHNETWKLKVARMLDRLNLHPVILAEQPDGGATLLEKLERYGPDMAYAVVLLTADDIGGVDDSQLSPRSRQNVILELGYFIAALGRGRVRALHEPGVELPSDVHGWVYTSLESDWQGELVRELKDAGLDVDANLLYE